MAYEKQTFLDGEVLTAAKLNRMEEGIEAAHNASSGGSIRREFEGAALIAPEWFTELYDAYMQGLVTEIFCVEEPRVKTYLCVGVHTALEELFFQRTEEDVVEMVILRMDGSITKTEYRNVGIGTKSGGVIFNDYDTNEASAKFSTSFGSKTRASGIGAIAMGVGSEAQAEASVAGGTTNESCIEDIAGVDIGILSDDLVTEALGERGIRLRDNLKANPASIASGVASISYGAGTRGYTALSMAFGIGAESGSKGFYIHKVTVPENGGNITVSLTTEQKPYYKYSLLGATIERNKTASWSDPTAKQLLSALEVGDMVNIILKKPYCLCESIVGVDAENGVITLTNTGGITKQNVEDATVFTDLVTAEGAMLALVPYQFSIAVPAKPDVGTVELHFAGIATGLGSIAAGTLSQAHGRMNLAAGQYGFVAGKDNVVGYCAFATGENNRALGYNSRADGLGTIASGTASYAGGHNTKASGRRSFAFGHGAVAMGDASVAFGTSCEAIGDRAFVAGQATKASGNSAVAMGYECEARGDGAIALGSKNKSTAKFAVTAGRENSATANCSVALGYGCVANEAVQVALGQWNKADASAMFMLGNGTSNSNRKNIFAVKKNGDTHILGNLYFGGIDPTSRNMIFTTRTETFNPTSEKGDYPGQIWRVLTDGSITSVYMYIGLSGLADGEEPCWIKLK